jgi:predicted  nucleic acid-binding Zn-ribbon protein
VNTVKQYYQLQVVDREWDEKSYRLAEVEDALGESQDVIRAREAVSDTEALLDAVRVQFRDLELEIAGLNAKLKQNQDRLYSGRVRNPKELSNLQEEAAALGRRLSELEDEQLELMITIEEEEAELAERKARSRQIESTWQSQQTDLVAEKERLELRLAELEAQRKQWRGRIGVADMPLYDDLRQRLAGIAVVLLKRGVCQTCGVDVPTGVARAVERGEGMHYCPVCARLLYGGG